MNMYAVILSDRGHTKTRDNMDLEKKYRKKIGIGRISYVLNEFGVIEKMIVTNGNIKMAPVSSVNWTAISVTIIRDQCKMKYERLKNASVAPF